MTMTKDDNLVPVFMPPFATLLANAEEVKGSPLTEAEVLRIRDDAACVAMPVIDANKLAESRGYRDVNPDNCWIDWHRLRVQMTGNGCLPRIVFCLLGNRDLEERCLPILEEEEIEYEVLDHDERMMDAFKSAAFGVGPLLADEDYQRIALHTTVLYILSDNFVADDAESSSQAFLQLGRRLLQAGAVAMKCESSGVAHPRDHWLKLATGSERGEQSPDYWSSLIGAYVGYPIFSEKDLYTCGMHLLGKPDLIVASSLLQDAVGVNEGESEETTASYLFRSFCMYLLEECRDGDFASGHTFRPDNNWRQLRVIWEECTGYDEDEFFFNPFGRLRFTE